MEKVEPNNFAVSFSALRKDVVNVLDFLERLKNEEDKISVDIAADQIERLKFWLASICTYVQLSYSELDLFEDRMTALRQEVYNMPHVLPSIMDNIDDCINSCRRSKLNATMTDEQLNFLLHNLHRLSKFCAEKIFPLVTEYEILQKVCGNIRDFHGLIVNGCIKHEIVENVLPQFQLMAERVGDFLWDELYSEDFQVIKLAHLFLKIIPIELEVMHMCFKNLKASTSAEVGHFIKQFKVTSPDILRECLNHLQQHMVAFCTPSTSGARNIHVMIEFLLIILTDLPTSFIHHDKLFDLLAHVGALSRKVSTLVCGLEEKSWTEESTSKTNGTTLDLLKDIELLKGDLRHVYMKAPDSSQICFPMSDGQLFMHLLLIHLNDLLDCNTYSSALIKEEIGLVKENLKFMRFFFVNAEKGFQKDLWKRVLDVAYEAKDVIDSIIVRDNGLLHLIFSLPLIIKNLNLIKEEVSNLHEKIPKNSCLTLVNSPNKLVESKASPAGKPAGKIIVGFEEETNWIIEKLTHGPADLDVISITGMPGLGKTTLAYKVYIDESVSSHFDIRAWCTVGQEYNEKKLLEKIFNQVLRKQLFGKRYLIVLDDLWDIEAWNELTRPFPKVEKGSRIILTTRQKEVTLHGKHNTDPLNLRLLRSEESWELLEKRAFGNESCPEELLDVGKKIAQNCKGLPLVVDLIAGVIAGLEKKKTMWLEIQNNLSSFILNSEVDVMKVIELSYDHLPVQLKPCFLYLVSYRKDGEHHVIGLKERWHAEGLVEMTETKSVQEVMEIYLNNLVSSSLVILFNEIGNSQTFQLHDLVHDFGLKKAKEEKFFDWISSSALSSSSSDLMPLKLTIDYDKEHFGLKNFVLFDSKKKRHSGKHLYSLSIYGGKLDKNLSDIFHLIHLRLLRRLTLDASFIMVKDSLLNEICMLNHLRYLHIGTKIKSLPLSFSNLWNLETLAIENRGTNLVLLPRIWDLVNLRMLCVSACSFFDLDADEPILIAENSKHEDIFKRLPNLQWLYCVLKESWDYSTGRCWFPKLDFLTELETLSIEFESSNINDSGSSVETNWSWDFHFPSNLKVLELFDFPLTLDSLSTIGSLPNLEEMFLVRAIIQGEEWNMREEDTFEKLKCLQLNEVNLAKWEVGEESFPVLEKLKLKECPKLEEIPPSFGDIYSLKIIKLVESPQLEDSAKNIKEYVEEMTGEDKLQILGPRNIPLFN
ncbi:unnamed protein product [Withania somnifera]